ncbi:PKD domain-containing protein [Arcticibacter eurypsychrophilus]|uniref:PKD domain-containing protein n=1 Tax=Arcticibacter eurypsychrophilus TaxID=1434752 RepID=UPI0009F1B743|nr:PKD domain-containing protein [Arcticibacter eurypsychrophilus]
MSKQRYFILFIAVFLIIGSVQSYGQDKRSFKIFQFPANQIPVVDGSNLDWKSVSDDYVIGMDQLWDDSHKHAQADPKNLNVQVKVGWVKGLNRLYFLYEAYDNYWDFTQTGLHNDIFELIVDGDQSGGPFIDRFHPNKELDSLDAYFSYHGVQAQNYHIFTPAEGKDWTLVWGSQPWIKELPYANAAYNYNFKPGEKGKLTLEFWITPFDYAGAEGPSRAVESVLKEGKNVGLCWAVIDFDDVDAKGNNGFWNLSKEHTMYGNSSYSLPFKLMPLDEKFKKAVEANWSFKVVDMDQRLVAFKDESYGNITSWKWDFGDQTTSDQQHPIHKYEKRGKYIVTLWVDGPTGKSRRAKVWDVVIR